MFENPMRGRQAKNFTKNVPKILDLNSSSEQIVSENRAFSHDVTAAILVFQNNETAAMLVYQQNPLGVELFSHVNDFFCSNKLA